LHYSYQKLEFLLEANVPCEFIVISWLFK
jgi:hypothetical protein